ncbi:protease pro-enzyme activation domain-containing protein [Rhodanobacter sp. MP7CTX1]|uniref:protease pro-enzyme activation domain-containing protein n=1 Tax=Rhodanobacter sp. MP7CTX1 TaxID=2723084 RepID=UPI00160CB9E1|nr:protease pro-enzyme activation domain-containing protein [Rhodanobacter sp. MP7CTX1]MBB6188091.1 hypothetical protein [Rhodanobacter sp. MP7CTX1]
MSYFCRSGLLATSFLLLGGGVPLGAHAANAPPTPAFAPDTARITEAVDNTHLVAVKGSRSLRTLTATDAGALPDSKPIRNMNLMLKRSADKQSRFDAYVNQLNNPASPNYHKWLTAKQVGSMFGPAQSDIDKVTTWLASQGLTVNGVYPSGTRISFSGTPSAVNRAFHTQLHSFKSNGESHFANVSEQQIPAALAPVVAGVASLDNFFPKPQYRNVGVVSKDKRSGKWKQVSTSPDFTVPPGGLPQDSQTAYDVVPADFNKIYNVEPLWTQSTPIRGAGQTVAVLERTDVQPADIATFRSAFLPADAQGVVSYVNPQASYVEAPGGLSFGACNDPGLNGDEAEAALDAEWIGAAAPDANVLFASCDDTNSPEFGPFTAALALLNSADGTPPPPVFSLSYGECEVLSITNVVNDAGELWELAASEGVTVFVASGDAGSVGCDQNQSAATFGINVNAMSSTPWNVSVGGTDFDDYGKQNNYWTSTNLTNGLSAISYVPEQTWNDSCASSKLDAVLKLSDGVTACNTATGQQFMNTAGGSGGPSVFWSQPAWQAGVYGVPANATTRMQPDLSLFAANGLYGHALVFCMSDPNAGGTTCDYSNPDNVLFNSAGGTSFAAPAMAGVQALINQATGQSNGLITPTLYALAAKEYGTNESPNFASLNACNSSSGAAIGSTCVFNDVTQGDNNEPCYAGTSDCYSGALGNQFGVVSHGGDVTLAPAWKTNVGYDYATGLGSINATNLVNAVVKYNQAAKRGYAAPGDFLSSYFPGTDGNSDIALVDPVQGIFTGISMKGSVAIRTQSQAVAKGYTALPGFFYPHINSNVGGGSSLALTLFNLASLAWTGPDNQLYVWLSDGDGSSAGYLRHAVGSPYPAGWTLVGAGDFNGPDGTGVTRSDLLWRNDSTGQIGWWQLNVGLLFRQHAFEVKFSNDVSPIMSAASGYVPTIADVNGDGYADIVWTNPNNNSVYVWINNQAGDFVRRQIQDHPAGFTLYGAGDITGTGKTDLIWTNPTSNQMSWWVMNGFNVVDQQTRSVAPGYTMSSIADYDGDGLADILWVGTAGDVYEWQSNGSSFTSLRVSDTTGAPIVIPAGAKVQPIRLQGTIASGGVDTGGL